MRKSPFLPIQTARPRRDRAACSASPCIANRWNRLSIARSDMPSPKNMKRKATTYWRDTQRLTLWLTAIWLVATFCVIFFARDLYGVTLFGWPVSFYMAAQGILLLYVAIVGTYA